VPAGNGGSRQSRDVFTRCRNPVCDVRSLPSNQTQNDRQINILGKVVGELGNWIEFEAQRMVIIVSSTTPSNQSTTKPQRARIKQRGNQQKLLLPPRGRDRAVGVRALLRSESSDKKVIRRTCRS
jgi:hypothetical protein